ncbi:unnamed protein product, partial [Ascophyllum nodosum]
ALKQQESRVFDDVLDELGRSSSKAQELAWPITTARKLRESADVVYVKCDETRQSLQGFLRLGWKHLFLCSDENASLCEHDVLCLLDFYVHESLRRRGVGHELLTTALKTEESTPTEIAYDRPSPELKSFLRKHFGLDNCVDQPNRFMVFKVFFGRDGCPRGA